MKHLTPFHNDKGQLKFPLEPLRDIVYAWPMLPPEKLGNFLFIPESHRKKHHDGTSIIVAIGPGYKDNKGKFHATPPELPVGTRVAIDLAVPWGDYVTGQDNEKHYVIICGTQDVRGIVEG